MDPTPSSSDYWVGTIRNMSGSPYVPTVPHLIPLSQGGGPRKVYLRRQGIRVVYLCLKTAGRLKIRECEVRGEITVVNPVNSLTCFPSPFSDLEPQIL